MDFLGFYSAETKQEGYIVEHRILYFIIPTGPRWESRTLLYNVAPSDFFSISNKATVAALLDDTKMLTLSWQSKLMPNSTGREKTLTCSTRVPFDLMRFTNAGLSRYTPSSCLFSNNSSSMQVKCQGHVHDIYSALLLPPFEDSSFCHSCLPTSAPFCTR